MPGGLISLIPANGSQEAIKYSTGDLSGDTSSSLPKQLPCSPKPHLELAVMTEIVTGTIKGGVNVTTTMI